jgi:hypothetical protein
MSATTQHAAIEALVSIFGAATTYPVWDGPNASEEAEYAAVWVGYDPTTDDGEAVASNQTWAQLGARRKEETGTITCCIGAWSGDTNTTPRRELVASILSNLEAAHRADITLGGVVLDSNFGTTVTLHQALTEGGNEVMALVSVAFRSRT